MTGGRYSLGALLIGACWLNSNAFAQRATDSEMAEQALTAVTRSTEPERIAAAKERAIQSLSELAIQRGPNLDAYATFVFNAGLSASQVQAFVDTYQLELFSAEAKIPMGDDGQVMTISTGVSMIDGELSDRLRMGTGATQFRMMNSAQALDGAARSNFLEAATAREPLYYRVALIGNVVGVQSAASDATVAGVFVDSTGIKAEATREVLDRAAEARQFRGPPIIRRLEDGPPPGVSPDRIIPFLIP